MKMNTYPQDTTSPLTSLAEEWWIEVQTSWLKITRPCLRMFLDMKAPAPKSANVGTNLEKYIENLIRERNPEATYWLKKAFFAAPNDSALFNSVRGWNRFLAIIDSTYVVHNEERRKKEEFRKIADKQKLRLAE